MAFPDSHFEQMTAYNDKQQPPNIRNTHTTNSEGLSGLVLGQKATAAAFKTHELSHFGD